ncbi:hypothetical protein [Mycobacterium marinum]|uniref:hypothetical protein n=1 Tax=Mycobacterium marinum TaxID=1781 RepID=UPI0021C32BAF|nr:hypothetical protein [Mycobacterium marinum]GJO41963.1 hypothetical protein NJB1604_15060 [Mycobacterium marinum]
MAELATHVALFDDKGVLHQFGPGSDVPAWARKKITNPAVWDEPPAVPEASGSGGGDSPPPHAGRGSGRDAWAAYAKDHHVDADGLERDEIITACQEAGVPV